ncbi:MAG: ABC transporter permease [Firmicutes bacterium]|nr:ABC transporter permease [Bacillota bacterium]
MNDKKTRSMNEPIVRIVKRDTVPLTVKIVVYAAAILLAAIVTGAYIYCVSDYDIVTTYSTMFTGVFRNDITVNSYFKETCLLLMISIALAPAFKMRFWNIGAQGQLLSGGLAAAAWLYYFGNTMPDAALLPIMAVSAVLIGGLWAMIPAIFKVKFGTNETLFTLMMNYIAIQLVACCTDIWKGIKSALGVIDRKAGYVGSLFGLKYGWIYAVALVLLVVMYVYMNKTKQGYEIAVLGEALNTARYAGINETLVTLRTVFISGAICGLVGFLYVSNLNHSIASSTGGGYGFTAIIVAWLAKFNPIFMLLISLLISFVSQGSSEIANKNTDLNSSVADITIGIFLFFILGCEFFLNYKLVRRRKDAVEGIKKEASSS